MPDVFLYSGDASPPNVILSDPTVLRGGSIVSAVGSAAGTSTAIAIGLSTVGSAATATGTGTASGIGLSLAASVGSSTGLGVASGIGLALDAAVASATGLGAGAGVGAPTAVSIAAATGLGAAAGIGLSTVASVGAATGVGAAAGIGTLNAAAVAVSVGLGAAAAVGGATVVAIGVAVGVSTALAVGTAAQTATGVATGVSVVSGEGQTGTTSTYGVTLESSEVTASTQDSSSDLADVDACVLTVEVEGAEVSVAMTDAGVTANVTGGMPFTIARNDTLPLLKATLLENGAPVNLTGASSVTFKMWRDATPVVDAAATVLNAALGYVQYTWQAADTATAGACTGYFVVVNAGKILTAPNNGRIPITISTP